MPDQPKIDFFWKPMGYTQPQGWATSNYQQSTTTSSVGPTVLSSPLRGRPFYPSPKPIFFLRNSRAWPALHPPKSSLPPLLFFFLFFFLFVLFFLDQMIEVFFLFIQIPCLGFFFLFSFFLFCLCLLGVGKIEFWGRRMQQQRLKQQALMQQALLQQQQQQQQHSLYHPGLLAAPPQVFNLRD